MGISVDQKLFSYGISRWFIIGTWKKTSVKIVVYHQIWGDSIKMKSMESGSKLYSMWNIREPLAIYKKGTTGRQSEWVAGHTWELIYLYTIASLISFIHCKVTAAHLPLKNAYDIVTHTVYFVSVGYSMCLCNDPCHVFKYIGLVNDTASEKPCIRWDNLIPHIQRYAAGYFFPEDNLTLAENYCRTPNNGAVPWCYIATSSQPRRCTITRCGEFNSHVRWYIL